MGSWNAAIGLPLILVSLAGLALIYFFGRPRTPGQGRRIDSGRRDADARVEPTLDMLDEPSATDAEGEPRPRQRGLDGLDGLDAELQSLGQTLKGERTGAASAHAPASAALSDPDVLRGRRPGDKPIERIVSLFVAAREGRSFRGTDLMVATEKVGLEYGDMHIFHRLVDNRPDLGPVFSVANMVKPGRFDLRAIERLETAGLGFFMTLPGPLPALDAWDAMLPAAQRLAELLDGLLLDEERNALGRQRIAHIRDELRGWDRRQEGEEVRFGPR